MFFFTWVEATVSGTHVQSSPVLLQALAEFVALQEPQLNDIPISIL